MVPTKRNASACLLVLLCLAAGTSVFAQSGTGSLRGQVFDPSGAVIPGAKMTVTGPQGTAKSAETNNEGRYLFNQLPPGKHAVRAVAKGFVNYENTNVVITIGRVETLDLHLEVATEKQQLTVDDTSKVDITPTNAAGAVVLKGQDLEVLSDNPDDLAEDLQALAGPAAGPSGGQIYIDGFTGGQVPPKSSIREIRVNQNPFSAEFDRLGFGRVEILTKPGTDNFHGQASVGFGDSAFNSRNPFAPNKPSYRSERFDGNLSGPINKKGSFFLGIEQRHQDEASVVSALILDPAFNVTPFSQAVLNPRKRLEISPRVDYQLTPRNTLVARYSFDKRTVTNDGIGQFSLPSVAYNDDDTEQTFQLSETAVLNTRTINEARFRYIKETSHSVGNNTQPSLSVLGAFTGGGSSLGLTSNVQTHYEIQNYTSYSRNTHFVRFGGRLRALALRDRSDQNFNGAFTFTSLDAYRKTLQGLENGQTLDQIRLAGGGPSQFSITGGNPMASVSQFDAGLFVQDDWRVRPSLNVSLGLRYETQNNIRDHHDIAPRIGFAWGLGGRKGRQPKTVIRTGAGIFYDRFSQDYTLQAIRLNGIIEQQFILNSPPFFPHVPVLSALAGNRSSQAIREVDPNLRAPYIIQAATSVQRQLPKNIMLSLTYTYSHGVHALRSRNINAPLPGTFDPRMPNSGTRPFGDIGNIYAYESTGIFNQNQFIAQYQCPVSRKFSLFGFYSLNKARSDTDGAGTFPANQYDLTTEYGRALFDVRHRFLLGGSLAVRYGFSLYPFIVASSGQPFNITLGRDLSGNSRFTDRPAFATDLSRPSVVINRFGAFDTNPIPGQSIIPRNFGSGPGQFTVNLRVSKTFGFGERSRAATRAGQQPGPAGRPGGLGPGPGPGMGGGRADHGERGGGRSFFNDATNSRYNLSFSIFARNLFNHVNFARPIGNLSSPLFGQSNAVVGGPEAATANRRIELQARFTF